MQLRVPAALPLGTRTIVSGAMVFGSMLLGQMVLSGAPGALAQAQSQAPSQAQPQEQPQSSAIVLSGAPDPEAEDAIQTLQSTVQNVLVDVVVTDKDGRHLHGLGPEQFQILENGIPRKVAFLEEHIVSGPNAAENDCPTQLPAHVYSNISAGPNCSSLMVLLLDSLNTQLDDQNSVRRGLLKFLDDVPSGTRIAIFTLSSHLRLLQGFTSDMAILRAALDSKAANPRNSWVLDNPDDVSMSDFLANMMAASAQQDVTGSSQGALAAQQATAAALMQVVSNFREFMVDQGSFQVDLRSRITLDAFNAIGTYLQGLPGRKNVVWFSGGFPLIINPDLTLSESFQVTRDYADDIRHTAGLLALARVAVYPVDGKGLVPSSVYGTANENTKYARNLSALSSSSALSNASSDHLLAESFQQGNSEFSSELNSEHSTMDAIAEATGGKAFYNTNGYKEALDQVASLSGSFYTLAYAPVSKNYDGKYRKVEVKVDKPGSKLAFRRGYYAYNPDDAPARAKLTAPSSVAAVMQRAAPDVTQIAFQVKVAPLSPQPDLSSPATRQGENGKNLTGPVVRYSMDWQADSNTLAMTGKEDGKRHGGVVLLLIGYDAAGKMLNSTAMTYGVAVTAEQYAQFRKAGLAFHQELDLPKGLVFLRVGIVDANNRRAGATEIPLLVKPMPRQTSMAMPPTAK